MYFIIESVYALPPDCQDTLVHVLTSVELLHTDTKIV